MTPAIKILDEGNREAAALWNAYICNHPSASGYHHLGWKRVLAKVYGYKSYYLYAEEADKIVGVLPLVEVQRPVWGSHLVSLPFTSYGGIVADNSHAVRELMKAASTVAQSMKASYIELRHIGAEPLELRTKSHKVTLILDLPDSPEALWKEFKTELRTDIRKRIKDGIEVQIGGAEQLANFYRIYSANMRDLGSPAYAAKFFSAIFDEWPGSARVATTYHRGNAIASGILLGFGKRIEIPWASSLQEQRRLRPNMLLYWECLRHAILCGYHRFDFGRSTPNSGTFVFKKQWGARAVPLHWQYWLSSADGAIPDLSPSNKTFRPAIELWRHLPLWLTRFVGPRLAKYFP